MKDQLTHWNNAHAEQWLHKHSTKHTAYAEEINGQLQAKSTILELGCGEGNDSIYFAEQGHTILATDFSTVAIEQNDKRWTHPNLTFRVQDISKPLQFDDASFDVVYARLSLHYFTNDTTTDIFREITRVLKPGGLLCFMCKSTDDHIYGQGDKIENDMYELNGHIRHFFSPEYVLKLLEETGINQEHVETGEEKIYDRQSAFIKVIARKPVQ
jgi:ubiquinone/menaquinone biosynthesis C-methylase UbiE